MINSTIVKQFVENNPKLVTKKSTSRDGVYVLKYARRVFFDDLWNDILENCRGTVIDEDYNIISLPFRKIYNYGIESKAPRIPLTTPITAYRKVNGFMASITWHNDDILVSTTGSIDSEFVDKIYSLIDIEHYRSVCKNYPHCTFLFECVHSTDPHIIPEQEGMYLIGYRHKLWDSTVSTTNLYQYANEFKCMMPESFITTLQELLEDVKTVKHEGFVLYTENGISAKIKSPYYLIKKALARKKDIMSLNKKQVPEEYYPLIEHLTSIKDEFNAKSEQDRLTYIREFLQQ